MIIIIKENIKYRLFWNKILFVWLSEMNYNIEIITEKSVFTISKKRNLSFSIITKTYLCTYAKTRYEFKKLYVCNNMAQKGTIIGWVLSRLFQLTDFKDLSLALSNCGFSYSLGSGSELGKPTYPAAGQVLDIDRHSQTDRHLMQSGLLY